MPLWLEYVLLPQAVHVASPKVVPAVNPTPGGHHALEWRAHGLPLMVNVPGRHVSAHVASTLALPGITGDPTLHGGLLCATQAVWFRLVEKVPEEHGTHDASVDDDPGT